VLTGLFPSVTSASEKTRPQVSSVRRVLARTVALFYIATPVPRITTFLSRLIVCGALLLLSFAGGSSAQPQSDDPVPDPEDPAESVPDSVNGEWMYDATGRLNFSQAAYKDWEEGAGNNSLALTANFGTSAARRGERWIQAHELRLAFGLINQEGQDLRKAEDQILWNSSVRYEGDDFFRLFNPTIAADLRTQFAKGFDYSGNPFEGELDDTTDTRTDLESPVQTSAFFSPAFITQSLGLTYEPFKGFTMRLGAAAKQTVVAEQDFRVLYGVDPDDPIRWEAGAEFASAFDRQITENIRYRSQLNVFFSFNQTEQPPDARWDNTVSLQVNDWLSTDLQFVALFDRDISRAIQLKETISVGVSFTLI